MRFQLGGRRQQHVRTDERVADLQQLVQAVRQIDARQHLDHLVRTGQHRRNGERAVVRRAEHDQAAARDQIRILHALPHLRMAANEIARDQSAERVHDKMARLIGEPRANELGEQVGRLIDIAPPVVRQRLDVPARAQRHHRARIKRLVDAGSEHAQARIGFGVAACRELQLGQAAADDAPQIDPDVVLVAAWRR